MQRVDPDADGDCDENGEPPEDAVNGPVTRDLFENLYTAKVHECINSLALNVARKSGFALEANELVSVAQCAIIKLIHKYDPEKCGGSFGGWAYQRAGWAMTDFQRKMDFVPRRARLAGVKGDPMVYIDAKYLGPDGDYSSSSFLLDTLAQPVAPDRGELEDDYRRLAQVARTMPDSHRQVITWSYFDGMSDTDIAERLGVTGSRVGQIRKRALAALRDKFERPPSANLKLVKHAA